MTTTSPSHGAAVEWQPTVSRTSTIARWTAPEKEEVWTKIDDENGERNIAKLTRRGNLWFTDPHGGGMYVYYTPTHWRPINDPSEKS